MLDTPQEILDLICHLTTLRDVGALRATCTELQKKIETVFKEMAFGTIEIHLDSKHLGHLKEVSQSRFASCVKIVHIRSRHKPFHTLSYVERDVLATFRSDKKDIQWLAEALSAFSNLARIEVEATSTVASQSSLAEEDDRIARSFAGLGTGPDGTRPHSDISYAFQVTLLAMAAMKKGSRNVPELRAGAMPNGIFRTSVDHTSLKPSNPSRYKGLAHLSALQLVLEVQVHTHGISRELNLAHFLHQTPKLKNLKLSFWHMAGGWLSNTFTDVKLPHLSALQVEAAHRMDVLELERFLERHTPTLRSLELKNIVFKNNVVVDVLSSIFISRELVLHSIKLQQLCNSRGGLLLFGTDADLRVACHDCDKDRDATWRSEVGPGCKHATLAAEGEVPVKEELVRVKKMCVLPFA